MKNDLVRVVLAFAALFVGAALEDLLPVVAGVGVPVLLGVVIFAAMEWPTAVWIPVALAGGALEEALSGLPVGTGTAFFMALGTLVGWTRAPYACMLLAFPVYELWLGIWMADLNGSVFVRMLLAFPVGAATCLLAAATLSWMQRKAGVDAR